MIKKVVSIKNVGRFVSSAAAGNPQLKKHVFITGANGYGKTTLCSIFRSLQSGDPSHILGRKTLGTKDVPTVELLVSTGNAKFSGVDWSSTLPSMEIFDGVFVAQNVYSGEVVDTEHKKNLYRIIVGEAGVQLANEEAALTAAARTKTTEIAAARSALQSHVPHGIMLEDFVKLPTVPDVDAKIANQIAVVDAVRQADVLRRHDMLSEYAIPDAPQIEELLARTLDDVAEDAERQLRQHLNSVNMPNGEAWVRNGALHAQDNCPFCGQSIKGLSLVTAYRAVFSERYEALVSAISNLRNDISQCFGETMLVRLDAAVSANKANIEFWSRYCTLDGGYDLPGNVHASTHELAAQALSGIERKAAKPLEPIEPSADFSKAVETYGHVVSGLADVNARIKSANAIIQAKKDATAATDVKTAEEELRRLQASQRRHVIDIDRLCATYSELLLAKSKTEKQKEDVRDKLNTHVKTVVAPYEKRINELLEAFNAGFKISETKHAYTGGTATSSYQLVINGNAVDVGDGKTPSDRPSFKNTLSAGDRTTLAMAFFLAHLERDQNRATKVVIFDDPFNSQDAFRRRQTIQEIMKIASSCSQLFVLSHDATFLKNLADKAPADSQTALAIVDHRAQGSKIIPIDLGKACQGRTATDIDDLQTYLTTGAGAPLDIIRKMRVVLETYFRTTYPNSFLPKDYLGDMARKIREEGSQHPAHALYGELDEINSYTSQYHHGEDTKDGTPDRIDPQELTGFTRRTLKIVNALQA